MPNPVAKPAIRNSMGTIIKVALGFVLGFFVISALVGPSSTPQKPSTAVSQKPAAPVSQHQFTGGTRDTALDKFERDMKKANKNYNECIADIRSGISTFRNPSNACDRNARR